MSKQLTAKKSEDLKQKALDYFERKGIDVRIKPTKSMKADLPQQLKENALKGMKVDGCVIEITSVLFYTYLVFSAPQFGTFEGHAGGFGVGELVAAGVLYYDNGSALKSTHDFGVFFGADAGGICQITWGSNGNATAVGIGDGLGAFGGQGDWI